MKINLGATEGSHSTLALTDSEGAVHTLFLPTSDGAHLMNLVRGDPSHLEIRGEYITAIGPVTTKFSPDGGPVDAEFNVYLQGVATPITQKLTSSVEYLDDLLDQINAERRRVVAEFHAGTTREANRIRSGKE